MTDYSAHDIHRLDQAYPDALADIEEFIGNPARKRRLAAVGAEVFAAELTRELAATFDKPMSLAGWAAIATVRLMEAGKSWEEDTDAAWAKVDELTAELAKTRDALTHANRALVGAEADRDSAVKANTAYANENDRLRHALIDVAKASGKTHIWDHQATDWVPVARFAAGKAGVAR